MEPQKLIKKIDDRDAVSILIGRYGNKIYARLYDRLRDKQLADEAFRKTVFSFLETVKRLESDDLTEALFSCIAENVCRDMQESAEPTRESCDLVQETADLVQESADAVQETADLVQERVCAQETPAPAIYEAVPESGEDTETVESVESMESMEAVESVEAVESTEAPSSFGHILGIAVLLFLIVIVVSLLWFVAGLGMQSGLIPTVDIGYSWFDRNVFPLFFEYGML